jgi:hypothetical protein
VKGFRCSITFLLTVSFLFPIPGALHFSYVFPVLGDAGQFLITDSLGRVSLDGRRSALGQLSFCDRIAASAPNFLKLIPEVKVELCSNSSCPANNGNKQKS